MRVLNDLRIVMKNEINTKVAYLNETEIVYSDLKIEKTHDNLFQVTMTFQVGSLNIESPMSEISTISQE